MLPSTSCPSFFIIRHPSSSTLFPYTTLFRSLPGVRAGESGKDADRCRLAGPVGAQQAVDRAARHREVDAVQRSEEHTSELQSRGHLVCRLLLEKKKIENFNYRIKIRFYTYTS